MIQIKNLYVNLSWLELTIHSCTFIKYIFKKINKYYNKCIAHVNVS